MAVLHWLFEKKNQSSLYKLSFWGHEVSSFFRRGPGQEYLKATLEAPIQELCNDTDLDLEINPMKVYCNRKMEDIQMFYYDVYTYLF